MSEIWGLEGRDLARGSSWSSQGSGELSHPRPCVLPAHS